MSGARGSNALGFAEQSLRQSANIYDTGFPLFQKGLGMSRAAVKAGGEPRFLGSALDRAQADAMDAAVLQAQGQADAGELATKGGIAGGNTGLALSGQDVGAKLAQFLRGSQTQRQNARISQILDAAGVSIGQTGTAGELQTRSLSNELSAISLLPRQAPGVTTALAAANLAGSIYGAGNGTWWNKPPSAQLQALPMQQTWMSRPAASPPMNVYGSTLGYMPSYWGY